MSEQLQFLETGCPVRPTGGQGTVHAVAESIAPENADVGVHTGARQMPGNNRHGVMPLPRVSTLSINKRYGRAVSLAEVLEDLGL